MVTLVSFLVSYGSWGKTVHPASAFDQNGQQYQRTPPEEPHPPVSVEVANRRVADQSWYNNRRVIDRLQRTKKIPDVSGDNPDICLTASGDVAGEATSAKVPPPTSGPGQ